VPYDTSWPEVGTRLAHWCGGELDLWGFWGVPLIGGSVDGGAAVPDRPREVANNHTMKSN